MQQVNKYLVGAAIGAVIMYLLLKKKKECPPCPKYQDGWGGVSTIYPALVVPPYPVPPPPAPKPTPPPPPPPPPPSSGSIKGMPLSFVGFDGWGNVK